MTDTIKERWMESERWGRFYLLVDSFKMEGRYDVTERCAEDLEKIEGRTTRRSANRPRKMIVTESYES